MLEQFFKDNQAEIKALVLEHPDVFPLTDYLVKVTPNSLHELIGWDKKNDLPIIRATFYSSNRIAQVLFSYDDFEYVFGQRSLRFASKTFNPAGGEATGEVSNNATWAGARGAASSGNTGSQSEIQSQLSGGHYWNWRMFQPFLTSSLGAGSKVTASNWQGYRDDSQEGLSNGFQNGDATTAEIVVSTQVDPTNYASTDYANVSFTSKGSLAFSSIGANNTYSTITITDQTVINKSGYTKLALITGRDLNNNAPTGNNAYTIQNHSQAHPPILTVTYTPASGIIGDI